METALPVGRSVSSKLVEVFGEAPRVCPERLMKFSVSVKIFVAPKEALSSTYMFHVGALGAPWVIGRVIGRVIALLVISSLFYYVVLY